jgi:hypothetical protein
MKYLIFSILLSASAFSHAQCAANVVDPTVPALSDTAIKVPVPAAITPELTNVCIMVWDAKKNTEVKKCKELVIRQKYQGTKVP